MTETENLLKDIKHYVEDGEMSFLIGAGFSRNVNKKVYPLWVELLKDVIWELFGSVDSGDMGSGDMSVSRGGIFMCY